MSEQTSNSVIYIDSILENRYNESELTQWLIRTKCEELNSTLEVLLSREELTKQETELVLEQSLVLLSALGVSFGSTKQYIPVK